MKKLLAIFAHPDDEGAIASTLAHYASHGTEVSLICATKGEAGGISDPVLATLETLADVRVTELQAACDIIGIRQLHFLGYRDSGMVDTPANEDPRSLVQATPDEAIGRIVALMRQIQPDVVVTYGEDNLFRKLPPEIVRQAWGDEHFILVDPQPSEALREHRAIDLFATLSIYSQL